MRLIDIKRNVSIAHENFKPNLSTLNAGCFFDNIKQTQIAIQALYDAGLLEYSEFKIDTYTEIMSLGVNRLKIDSNLYNVFSNEFKKIDAIINFMFEWLNRYVPAEETETTVNIKLPKINDLSDFSASALCIKKALSQIVSEAGGNIKVKQFDHGSFWLIIDVGTMEAVKLIGAIVTAAYATAKGVLNLLKTIEELKSLKLDNLDKLNKLQEREFIHKKALQEAEKINNKFYLQKENEDHTASNERCDRICVSITELVKLLRAGGEVHPALESKKTIDDIYPKYTTSLSFTPITALLTQQDSSDVKENDKQDEPHSQRTDDKQE